MTLCISSAERCSGWLPCYRSPIWSWPCRARTRSPGRSSWRKSAMCVASHTRTLWLLLRVWTLRRSNPALSILSPAAPPNEALPICEKTCLWSPAQSSSIPIRTIQSSCSWTKRSESRQFYVYTIANAAKFLRVYYSKVKARLAALDAGAST